MFKPVGSLISQKPTRGKIGGTLLALQIRQVAAEVFRESLRDFGDEVLALIKVKTYRSGTLVVVAPPVVSAELHMRSGELIDGINKKIGVKVVRELRLRAG